MSYSKSRNHRVIETLIQITAGEPIYAKSLTGDGSREISAILPQK